MNREQVLALKLRLAEGLQQLHSRWVPHPAQVAIGQALFARNFSEVFAVCGRNFGKTELVAYSLWRYAWTFPGSENYYFSPYMKQSREILWQSNRLQAFGPKAWIEGKPNDTEMRIKFRNGSFIKLDGSDNVEAYRGVKPKGLSVFDEFKDFKPQFFEAYDPNRAAFNSPLLIIGTPPEAEGQFSKVYHAWKEDDRKAVFSFPTSANPHIDRGWLERKKEELYQRGDGDIWEREYEAKFVKSGAKSIFPMLTRDYIRPHSAVLQEIYKDRRKLEWFAWADPAGASCFAVLFAAINPYTRTIYFLDEIYETRQQEMTVNKVGARIVSKCGALYDPRPGDTEWRHGYDEAETWFANEMLERFGLGLEPTQKAKHDKTTGLSLLKDAFLAKKVVISDRCEKFYWELDNYQKDDDGKIVKKNDHLIDCARYILGASYYSLNESEEVIKENDPMWRGARIEDDFPGFDETGEKLDDWEIF